MTNRLATRTVPYGMPFLEPVVVVVKRYQAEIEIACCTQSCLAKLAADLYIYIDERIQRIPYRQAVS